MNNAVYLIVRCFHDGLGYQIDILPPFFESELFADNYIKIMDYHKHGRKITDPIMQFDGSERDVEIYQDKDEIIQPFEPFYYILKVYQEDPRIGRRA